MTNITRLYYSLGIICAGAGGIVAGEKPSTCRSIHHLRTPHLSENDQGPWGSPFGFVTVHLIISSFLALEFSLLCSSTSATQRRMACASV
jgi:hypothetical protein